ERVLAAQNPAMDKGLTAASVPPVTMISACPLWMTLKASPIEWEPEAHAVTVHALWPFAPIMIETCPDAISGIIIGTKKGLTRSGPFSNRLRHCSSKV